MHVPNPEDAPRAQLSRRGLLLGAVAASAGAAHGRPPQDAVEASAPAGLAPLPYGMEDLSPLLSTRTLSFHFTRIQKVHHDKLQALLPGTPFEGLPLEEIVERTRGAAERAALHNHAAELWNHDFHWRSMKPNGGGRPPAGELLARIERSFGSFEGFYAEFLSRAKDHFGSGWAWVVQAEEDIEVLVTEDALNPLGTARKPLLALDLWEHAYYLDYQDRRGDYVVAFLDSLVDWDFATQNLKQE